MRGRKIASSDPDLGAWTYAYDTASELVSQTDAKSQTTTLSYDLLGRMTGRVETDMTSAWVYDTKAWGIGKLTSASITAGPSAGYEKSLIYDSLGRTVQVTITVGGINYPFYASYDANSRLSTVTYPRASSPPTPTPASATPSRSAAGRRSTGPRTRAMPSCGSSRRPPATASLPPRASTR